MPVTDPLLKSLKYLIEEFLSTKESINDSSPYLAPFCQTVEHAFTQGIRLGGWNLTKEDCHSTRRKHFWSMLEHFQTSGPVPLQISSSIYASQQNSRLKHGDGKVRFLIRKCLAQKVLHVLVEFFIHRQKDLTENWYDSADEFTTGPETPIMTSEHLAEQMRSLLMTVSNSLQFDLNQENCFFLDHTWNIPDMRTIEFVPTRELGLGILYIQGHIIITKTKDGSIAADNPEIGIGDLVVAMNGRILFQSQSGGEKEILAVWKRCRARGEPCRITIVKPRCPATGGIFKPLNKILNEYHDVMEEYYNKEQKKYDEKMKAIEEKKAKSLSPEAMENGTAQVADELSGCGSYEVRYVGEVPVGSYGGMSEIEGVIKSAVMKKTNARTMDVLLDITEISVITRSKFGQETLPCNSKICPTKDHEQLLDLSLDDGEEIQEDKVENIESKTETNANQKVKSSSTVMFTHKFADISSCGKIITEEKHFCYIAGDTFCTISKQFKGYVYEAKTTQQARIILNNIYQGFKRTTFFM